MRIAVLSDIHAMADGFEAALLAARNEGFDHLLILGDILTYGIAPRHTLDLLADCVARDDATLVAGNHDQMYLDLADGENGYFDRLPDWLRETVEWTAHRVGGDALQAFAWRPEWSCGTLLSAHANPFSFGDWTYIGSHAEAQDAAKSLSARGFSYGLFGHVHRHRRYMCEDASVFTVGSLGQPRDADDPNLQWAMVTMDDDDVTVSARTIGFDRQAHVAAIRATSLSMATQDRLCGFFA